MEGETKPVRPTRPPEPVVVSITVTNPPPFRGRPFRERLAGIGIPHRARVAVAVMLVLAAAGTIIATVPLGSSAPRSAAPQLPRGERAAIAGALGYPYPVRCLKITISASDPDFARADVDRANGCGGYRGYTNASLHRVGGAWRLVLDEGQLFVPNSLLGGSGAVAAAHR